MNNCDKISMERMAETISDNRTRYLFEEQYQIKGRNNFAPSNVDGFNNEHYIEQVFSTKYRNLYNDNDNDNDNDKVFYSTLIIHFISHITVINAFAY